MDRFLIKATDFGIDRSRSRLTFERGEGKARIVDLVIHGHPETHAQLTNHNESDWSWSLYPPKLYVSSYPVPADHPLEIDLSPDDGEDYDIALYMMEHHPIEAAEIEIDADGQVEIRGWAELSGELVDFAISWASTDPVS